MLLKNRKGLTRCVSTTVLKPPMSTQLDSPTFDSSNFQYHLPQIYRSVLKDFKKIVRSSIRLHLSFLSLLVGELIGFAPFTANLPIFASALGALFLTLFSYVILLFYYQAKKPDQLLRLREQFLQSCRQLIVVPAGESGHHLSIAEALSKLASYLEDFESNFYKTPALLAPVLGRISAYCHWEDVFKMKRLLLQAAVEEHLKQVRATPTDLEVHASLAGTYVALSKLYRDAIPFRKKQTEALTQNLNSAAKLAIEELRILNHYAPNDPWVHEQLALGYSRLNMPDEERAELEALLKLRPQDNDILFRLGTLYFHLGMNAKGLQIYQDLMQCNFKKAEELIASYGACDQ